jgi:hypothetical protein
VFAKLDGTFTKLPKVEFLPGPEPLSGPALEDGVGDPLGETFLIEPDSITVTLVG